MLPRNPVKVTQTQIISASVLNLQLYCCPQKLYFLEQWQSSKIWFSLFCYERIKATPYSTEIPMFCEYSNTNIWEKSWNSCRRWCYLCSFTNFTNFKLSLSDLTSIWLEYNYDMPHSIGMGSTDQRSCFCVGQPIDQSFVQSWRSQEMSFCDGWWVIG